MGCHAHVYLYQLYALHDKHTVPLYDSLTWHAKYRIGGISQPYCIDFRNTFQVSGDGASNHIGTNAGWPLGTKTAHLQNLGLLRRVMERFIYRNKLTTSCQPTNQPASAAQPSHLIQTSQTSLANPPTHPAIPANGEGKYFLYHIMAFKLLPPKCILIFRIGMNSDVFSDMFCWLYTCVLNVSKHHKIYVRLQEDTVGVSCHFVFAYIFTSVWRFVFFCFS